jgi:hypothetical protein
VKPTIRFSLLPTRVKPGANTRVVVNVRPDKSLCSIGVRYPNGKLQGNLHRQRATHDFVVWAWRIPETMKTGLASVNVTCARVGKVAGTFRIIPLSQPKSSAPKPTAPVKAPAITVQSLGFSVRPRSFTTTANYGVVIVNASATDARGVSVLVNFADASDLLVGTARSHIGLVAAHSSFYVGGLASLSGMTAVAKMEAVARADSGTSTLTHPPRVANARPVPGTDPAWVGSIQGEIVNDTPDQVLRFAQVHAVVLNSAGEIIGGANGAARGPAPPGARLFFKISNTSSIPTAQAATIQASVVPTYRAS